MTPSPDIPVLALPTELTTDRIEAVEEGAQTILGDEGAYLVVDLAQTAFVCSSGLGMLVKISKRLHDGGGAIALARPLPPIARLLRAVGLEVVLPSFATVDAATAFLRERHAAANSDGAPAS